MALKQLPRAALVILCVLVCFQPISSQTLNATKLQQFVDELPQLPVVRAYEGKIKPVKLTIGMYQTKWKFHRDLPATTVFAYGTSAKTASVPGPTIEARNGVPVEILWENHLPNKHILPFDKTLRTASPKHGGVPTVVHLHGGMNEPQSDGHSHAWFTAGFRERGPKWSKKVYHYYNAQGAANLWYHDHAMGLTRANILAGLSGAYVIRDAKTEGKLNLPSGSEYDRVLIIADKDFNRDGSIYMNPKGNNPKIHPEWQPEYFGSLILVNGKAWPYLRVQRRKYRFRIINSSNARFYQLSLANSSSSSSNSSSLRFTQIGCDAFYLPHPVHKKQILISPSEIFDVAIDFSKAGDAEKEIVLKNSAPYPFPSGDPVDADNGHVMKFIVEPQTEMGETDSSSIPRALIKMHRLAEKDSTMTRHVNLYEFESAIGEPTHLFINAKSFDAPVTEIPRAGTTELWHVINLTEDNHPLHVHLAGFQVLSERRLRHAEEFRSCLLKNKNRFNETCNVEAFVVGKARKPPRNEAGWKNVYKMKPSHATSFLVRFTNLNGEAYPFDASVEPGYVYHCHILDHEDNEMMRPYMLRK